MLYAIENVKVATSQFGSEYLLYLLLDYPKYMILQSWTCKGPINAKQQKRHIIWCTAGCSVSISSWSRVTIRVINSHGNVWEYQIISISSTK